ncbi:glycosyl hydrolase 108 family protein [Sphingomonas sp.]|uniref:glycoside hydrolase family 108 protein n=1 Tax=Sphingomonas sp. TaxID=28214 RepID=UPI0031E3FF38
MSKTINGIIEDVLANEGGYVNDPRDAGGETMYGITIATARANGYQGKMRDLPRETAFDIYRRRYVVAPGFDQIATISAPIAAELVDTGVNMGPVVAAKFLQRALNALNNQGKDFADLAVDGQAGANTRRALNAFLNKRGAEGEAVMLAALNALQGERYISLGEARQANEAFMFGWFRTRVAA